MHFSSADTHMTYSRCMVYHEHNILYYLDCSGKTGHLSIDTPQPEKLQPVTFSDNYGRSRRCRSRAGTMYGLVAD